MTAPVEEGLRGFLEQEWGGPVSISSVRESSVGARRRNVLFHADGPAGPLDLVATILPPTATGLPLNPVDAEAAMRRLAASHGVPVPGVHGVCLDESVAGGAFFVSTLVEGETVPRRVLRLAEETGVGDTVVEQMGAAMARLHAIDTADAPAGLIEPIPGPPAEAALTAADELMSLVTGPRPALALGMRWLERHLPEPPVRESIVHTDIRNGNIIVGPDGLRAVLDWEGTRRRGDPMEDLAWPALRMWRFRADEREVGGLAGLEPLVRGYEAAGGVFDADRYRWWKVLGTLRWALGLAAQAAGHLEGSYRSIVLAASGRRVPEMEWDLLMLLRP